MLRRVNLLNLALILSLAFSGTLSGILVPIPVAAGTAGMPTVNSGEAGPDLAPRWVQRQRPQGHTEQNRQQQSKPKNHKQPKDQKQKTGKADRKQKTGKADRKKKNKKKDRSGRNAGTGQDVEDHYIVVLKPSGDSPERAADAVAMESSDVAVTQVYEHVFDGFAAVIPADQVEDVRDDPRVQAVVPDEEVHIFAQTLPTGINRIDADQNATAKIDGSDQRVDVDVAVLDTGIGPHPDLNVAGGVNVITLDSSKPCDSGNSSYADDHGHGTHVAGTIGAVDDDTGVVGVAPGARLWAVKVLRADGLGRISDVICGLDWVVGNGEKIDVINMSFGANGSDSTCSANDPLHDAICAVVNAGITAVVAAGNSGTDAATTVPAAYDEVITVSALIDTDGKPGGMGGSTSAGADDTRWSSSNFGGDVDIAAPGVGILSTSPGGSTQESSGTSMASPHVAGAAALYLANHSGANPSQVRDALRSTRESVNGISEGVLYVGDGTAPSTVSPAPPGTGTVTAPTSNQSKHKHKKKKGKGKGKMKRR
jgi:subtilisin